MRQKESLVPLANRDTISASMKEYKRVNKKLPLELTRAGYNWSQINCGQAIEIPPLPTRDSSFYWGNKRPKKTYKAFDPLNSRAKHVPGLRQWLRELDRDLEYSLGHLDCGAAPDEKVFIMGYQHLRDDEVPEGFRVITEDDDVPTPPVEAPWIDAEQKEKE